MDVVNYTIRTPFDYPHTYDVNWRHEVAMRLDDIREEGTPCPMDDMIRKQARYLKEMEDPNLAAMIEFSTFSKRSKTNMRSHLHHANTIYRASGRNSLEVLKDRIEALLLCAELNYAQIAKYLSIKEPVVRIYERLFYHVRDDEGSIFPSPWLREYFATQGAEHNEEGQDGAYWKTIAVQGGFRVLYQMWGWTSESVEDGEDFPEKDAAMMMMRNLVRSMDRRVRFDNLDPRSLVQFYDSFQNSLKDMRERGLIQSESVATDDDVAFHFLSLLRPKMRELDEETMLAKQEELTNKIRTIKEMDRTSDKASVSTLSEIGAQLGK